jgi:hypothetical protein
MNASLLNHTTLVAPISFACSGYSPSPDVIAGVAFLLKRKKASVNKNNFKIFS